MLLPKPRRSHAWLLSAGIAGTLMLAAQIGALAQAPPQPFQQPGAPPPPTQLFVPSAKVTVANNSNRPESIGGAPGVRPFVLGPHQQAVVTLAFPPPPAGPGAQSFRYPNPARFELSVGNPASEFCKADIEMTFTVLQGRLDESRNTNCVAHTIATNDASCRMAMSAKNSACVGGLNFSAP